MARRSRRLSLRGQSRYQGSDPPLRRTPPAMRIAPLLILATLAACAGIPDLPGTSDPGVAQGFPALVPLAPLLTQAAALDGASRITPATTADIAQRVAALRARAARLRGPVIAPTALARLRQPIDTSALQ